MLRGLKAERYAVTPRRRTGTSSPRGKEGRRGLEVGETPTDTNVFRYQTPPEGAPQKSGSPHKSKSSTIRKLRLMAASRKLMSLPVGGRARSGFDSSAH